MKRPLLLGTLLLSALLLSSCSGSLTESYDRIAELGRDLVSLKAYAFLPLGLENLGIFSWIAKFSALLSIVWLVVVFWRQGSGREAAGWVGFLVFLSGLVPVLLALHYFAVGLWSDQLNLDLIRKALGWVVPVLEEGQTSPDVNPVSLAAAVATVPAIVAVHWVWEFVLLVLTAAVILAVSINQGSWRLIGVPATGWVLFAFFGPAWVWEIRLIQSLREASSLGIAAGTVLNVNALFVGGTWLLFGVFALLSWAPLFVPSSAAATAEAPRRGSDWGGLVTGAAGWYTGAAAGQGGGEPGDQGPANGQHGHGSRPSPPPDGPLPTNPHPAVEPELSVVEGQFREAGPVSLGETEAPGASDGQASPVLALASGGGGGQPGASQTPEDGGHVEPLNLRKESLVEGFVRVVDEEPRLSKPVDIGSDGVTVAGHTLSWESVIALVARIAAA